MKYLLNNIFLWEIVTEFPTRIKKIYSGRERYFDLPPSLLTTNSNKQNRAIYSLGENTKNTLAIPYRPSL